MRVLLDENLPRDLASALGDHEVATVAGLGWAGVSNGELLQRAATRFDALLTMDSNLEFQQTVAQPLRVIVIRAHTNRLADLLSHVPDLLRALRSIKPGEVRRIGD